MAKFEIKFLDATFSEDFIETYVSEQLDEYGKNYIEIKITNQGSTEMVYLDKSTAIKFAKTLRTEINKITESEVNHGE